MFALTRQLCPRMPLAMFTIKHFQCKQKYALTPDNFMDVFSTAAYPRDRLLRQSSTGGGATRVLLLDKKQHVKGVYNPLLCLPHPAVVEGGGSALGLPVERYLDCLSSAKKLPTTFMMISHPYGVGVAAYKADGTVHMPLHNITAPPELVEKQAKYQQQLHQEQQESPPIEAPPAPDVTTPSPLATPAFVATIIAAIAESYEEFLTDCSTFFYVTRDKTASLTLAELRQEEERAVQSSGAVPCVLPFSDKRWVALPDSMLQADRQAPLYTRDRTTKERIVSQAGLTVAVTHGRLELDVFPRWPGEEGGQEGDAKPAAQG